MSAVGVWSWTAAGVVELEYLQTQSNVVRVGAVNSVETEPVASDVIGLERALIVRQGLCDVYFRNVGNVIMDAYMWMKSLERV